METCDECGTTFDVDEARQEYESETDFDDYDDYAEGLCGSCATLRAESDMAVGRGIDMLNGEEEYDPNLAP